MAVAGDLNVTTDNHSKEGISLLASTATVTSPTATYTVLHGYSFGDSITITLTKDAVSSSFTWPTTLSFTPNTSPSTARTMTVTFSEQSVDSAGNTLAKYSVTEVGPSTVSIGGVTTSTTTRGGVLTLPNFPLAASAVAAGDITIGISSLAADGVTSIDVDSSTGKSRTGSLTRAINQFVFTVGTKFDQRLDGDNANQSFVGSANDNLSFTIANDSTLRNATTSVPENTEITIRGASGKMSGIPATAFAGSGTRTFDESASSLKYTYTGLTASDTITFTPPGSVALQPQSFTVDAKLIFSSSEQVLASGVDAGRWVHFEYVPTLSEWVMICLTLVLILAGVQQVKKFTFLRAQG